MENTYPVRTIIENQEFQQYPFKKIDMSGGSRQLFKCYQYSLINTVDSNNKDHYYLIDDNSPEEGKVRICFELTEEQCLYLLGFYVTKDFNMLQESAENICIYKYKTYQGL